MRAYREILCRQKGNFIKAEWLQRYDIVPAFTRVVCALDAAAKTGVRNDYSAIVKIGMTRNEYYVLDVWRDRVEFPSLMRRVKDLEREDPEPSKIYVEDTSNATALIQQLKEERRLAMVPVAAKGSERVARRGNHRNARSEEESSTERGAWLIDFERELLRFRGEARRYGRRFYAGAYEVVL